MPKQYLPIRGQPIALYSLALFASLKEVGEIIVVCDPSYRQLFENAIEASGRTLQWASPGKERQDSVFNGLQEVHAPAQLVCVHDSARPLLTKEDTLHVFRDALQHGAAVLGVPVKQTIKEAKAGGFVLRTLERSKLWEMQTPQVIKPDLLRRGFEHVREKGLEVTDDVSIVEYLNAPVKITQGSYTNLKITTPEDLLLAEKLIAEAEKEEAAQELEKGVQAVHVSDLTLQQV